MKISIALISVTICLSLIEAFTKMIVFNQNKNKVLGFYQNDDLIAQSLEPQAHGILESREKGEFKVEIDTTNQGFRDVREYAIPNPPPYL